VVVGGTWFDEFTSRVYKNGLDRVEQVYGPGEVRGYANGITPDGRVLWTASDLLYDHVYVDTTDISGPVIGNSGRGRGLHINNQGTVLWCESGEDGRNLFVDDVCVTQDLFGAGTYSVGVNGWDINDKGQVLWSVSEPGHGRSIYLSTPVPEPPASVMITVAIASFLRLGLGWGTRRRTKQ